ncbi:uncharacterized protein LOC144455665 [Phascolarctos cinereus]
MKIILIFFILAHYDFSDVFCHGLNQTPTVTVTATDHIQAKEKMASDAYQWEIDEEEYSCDIFQSRRRKKIRFCSLKIHLLCGTNNITYPSLCVFCYVNIASQGKVQLKNIGKCQRQ